MNNLTLEQLQLQLESLKAQLAKPIQTTVSNDELKKLIQAELGSYSNIQTEVKSEPIPEIKQPTLLELVGLNLTKDEQLWFSDLSNLKNIDPFLIKFLSSEDGQKWFRFFVDNYKESYENKTQN